MTTKHYKLTATAFVLFEEEEGDSEDPITVYAQTEVFESLDWDNYDGGEIQVEDLDDSSAPIIKVDPYQEPLEED